MITGEMLAADFVRDIQPALDTYVDLSLLDGIPQEDLRAANAVLFDHVYEGYNHTFAGMCSALGGVGERTIEETDVELTASAIVLQSTMQGLRRPLTGPQAQNLIEGKPVKSVDPRDPKTTETERLAKIGMKTAFDDGAAVEEGKARAGAIGDTIFSLAGRPIVKIESVNSKSTKRDREHRLTVRVQRDKAMQIKQSAITGKVETLRVDHLVSRATETDISPITEYASITSGVRKAVRETLDAVKQGHSTDRIKLFSLLFAKEAKLIEQGLPKVMRLFVPNQKALGPSEIKSIKEIEQMARSLRTRVVLVDQI